MALLTKALCLHPPTQLGAKRLAYYGVKPTQKVAVCLFFPPCLREAKKCKRPQTGVESFSLICILYIIRLLAEEEVFGLVYYPGSRESCFGGHIFIKRLNKVA